MGWNWGGAASGGVQGGMVGSYFGPVGTGIGAVIGTTLGGLFGGGGGDVTRQDPRTTDYMGSAGHYGGIVPVLWGTRWVTGQVVQLRFVQVSGVNSNGSIPSAWTGDTWRLYGFVLALVQGRIQGVSRLMIDDVEYQFYADAGLDLQFGDLDGNGTTIADDGNGRLWEVFNPGLAHFRSHHRETDGSYADYVDLEALYQYGALNPTGNAYGEMPQSVNSSPTYRALTAGAGIAAGSIDSDPWQIISDACHRSGPLYQGPPIWGAGWPAGRLEQSAGTNGLASSGFATYALANGWRLALLVESQMSAADIAVQVATACDSELVCSDGKLKLLPRGEVAIGDFVPDNQPACDVGFADFVSASGEQFGEGEDPVGVTMAPDSQVYNVIPVEFRDRSRKDEANTATKAETADVNELVMVAGVLRPRGERRSSAISLPCITNQAHAEAISASIARRAVWQRGRWTFHLPWRFAFLEPMDLVRITDPVGGWTGLALRILTITDAVVRGGDGDTIVYTLECEEYLGETQTTAKVDMSAAA